MSETNRTYALLCATFGRDLGGLVYAYFRSATSCAKDIGRAGCFDQCIHIVDAHRRNLALCGAAKGDHSDLVVALLDSGARSDCVVRHAYQHKHTNLIEVLAKYALIDPRMALEGACAKGDIGLIKTLYSRPDRECIGSYYAAKNGHTNAVLLLADSGRVKWNQVLLGACVGAHPSIAKLALDNNANCDEGSILGNACYGDSSEIIAMLAPNALFRWDNGLIGACRGGHLDRAHDMIARGATSWNDGLGAACRGGHIELARLMIAKGASDWDLAKFYARQHDRQEMLEFIETAKHACASAQM